MTPRTFRNQIVQIADLVKDTNIIRGLTFERCTITGPAVIAFHETIVISPAFTSPLEEVLWPPIDTDVPEGATSRTLAGAVALNHCKIDRCRFDRIGIVGSREDLEAFRNAFA